ncbi:MAG: condensation domain-containing protein, partial [Bradyrhizobium guangdongense]
MLSDIWIDLLKVDRLGVTENFFDLGGHSLLAGQAMARVARALGVSLPIKTIFEAPTVEQQARRVDEALATQTQKPLAEIPRLAQSGPPPLSIAQAAMVTMERELPGLPLFNLPFALRLQGPLDVTALSRALGDVVRRHEALRTTFGGINDAPGLRITAPGKIGEVLTVEPIGDGGRVGGKRLKALQLKKIKLLAEQEAWEPLDMTRAPLLRARLLRMQADDHVLLLTFHHAVADGWSIGIVFDEISRRYAALVGRPTEPLQKLPLSFADVARWQRWWCGTEAAKRRAAEWTDALRGATPVFTSKDGAETIPAGRPTGYHPLRLNGELIAEISTFASSQNGTLFMALMTALKAVLALRTGRNDICVATSMANRTQPDTDLVIGPFE